jgi:hypothetical protein
VVERDRLGRSGGVRQRVGPVRLESTGRCATAGRDARTCAETRDAWSPSGPVGLGLSRFVSAGVVLGTDLVYLSATVRGYGEPARFRPGGVVDPDTGCCLADPRGADLD